MRILNKINILINNHKVNINNSRNGKNGSAIWGVLFSLSLLIFLIPSKISAAPKDPEFTVVIDAGHGGHDHGAIDNGAREKDINLGVSTKLAELIRKKMKNVKVVMTRENDSFISLQERANIANRNKGDLFISIHTNSVDKTNPNRSKISGASVYTLGSQKTADNLRIAQRENSVIELERDYHQKYSGFDPSKDESYIIFEMAQKKTIGQSLKFAEKAQKELIKSGRSDRGVRQAGFWVLWATSMPAVLVELDFICNPEAAAYLNSSKGQQELAEALFKAFELYVDTQKKSTVKSTAQSNVPAGTKGVEPKLRQDFDSTVQPESATFASTEEEKISSVPSVTAERKPRNHNASTPKPQRNSYGPRKRRSQASKDASEKRVFETESIVLKSETDYLAKEPEEPEVKEEVTPDTNDSKGKKGKKNKKQKIKKEKKPKEQKSKKQKGSNQKTFVVKSGGAQLTSESTPGVASGNNSGLKAESNKKSKPENRKRVEANKSSKSTLSDNSQAATPKKKIYKILLVSSDMELDYSDSQFHGINPSGMFKENGQYKYTLGGSENRKEIETKLMEIRAIIPSASIIVRME